MSSDSTVSATVDIIILDINDHLPLFEQPFYQVNVSELAEINSTVATLRATDSDEVHVTASLQIYHVNMNFRRYMQHLNSPSLMSRINMNYCPLLLLLRQYKILALQKSHLLMQLTMRTREVIASGQVLQIVMRK